MNQTELEVTVYMRESGAVLAEVRATYYSTPMWVEDFIYVYYTPDTIPAIFKRVMAVIDMGEPSAIQIYNPNAKNYGETVTVEGLGYRYVSVAGGTLVYVLHSFMYRDLPYALKLELARRDKELKNNFKGGKKWDKKQRLG